MYKGRLPCRCSAVGRGCPCCSASPPLGFHGRACGRQPADISALQGHRRACGKQPADIPALQRERRACGELPADIPALQGHRRACGELQADIPALQRPPRHSNSSRHAISPATISLPHVSNRADVIDCSKSGAVLLRHLSEADLTEYADGELAGSRLRRAEEHLRVCPSCASALEQARATARVLLALPPTPLPHQLRPRIVAKLAAQPAPQLGCREARALLHQSLDTRLSLLASGFLRLHLDSCPDCNLEFAELSQAATALRSLSPVPSPLGIRDAVHARLRRPLPVTRPVRLRPALAAVTMAAALLFLLRPTLQPIETPRQIAAEPPLVVSPVTSAPPPASETSEQATTIAVLPPSVEAPDASAGDAAPSVPRPVTTARESRPVRREITLAFIPTRHLEPTVIRPVVHEGGPSALRALRVVASAAATRDVSPHTSMATMGERLATLNSEAIAAFPELGAELPAGEPTIPPPSSGEHDPDATSSANPPNLTGLMEGSGRIV